jgi:predicted nuclease of predicted toxin-antitoxin system
MIRVLLDEDVPIRLRTHFPQDVDVETVQYRGWKGLKNGALLAAASAAFDALLTMDNNLLQQQNLAAYDLAVLVLRAPSKRMADLLPLMPEVVEQLRKLSPGAAVWIHPPQGE